MRRQSQISCQCRDSKMPNQGSAGNERLRHHFTRSEADGRGHTFKAPESHSDNSCIRGTDGAHTPFRHKHGNGVVSELDNVYHPIGLVQTRPKVSRYPVSHLRSGRDLRSSREIDTCLAQIGNDWKFGSRIHGGVSPLLFMPLPLPHICDAHLARFEKNFDFMLPPFIPLTSRKTTPSLIKRPRVSRDQPRLGKLQREHSVLAGAVTEGSHIESRVVVPSCRPALLSVRGKTQLCALNVRACFVTNAWPFAATSWNRSQTVLDGFP